MVDLVKLLHDQQINDLTVFVKTRQTVLIYVSDFVVLKQRNKKPECNLLPAMVHELSHNKVHPLYIT